MSEIIVKPLSWSQHHETRYAQSIIGRLALWEIAGRAYLQCPGDIGGRLVGRTIEDGKAAALATIRDSILSAIDLEATKAEIAAKDARIAELRTVLTEARDYLKFVRGEECSVVAQNIDAALNASEREAPDAN